MTTGTTPRTAGAAAGGAAATGAGGGTAGGAGNPTGASYWPWETGARDEPELSATGSGVMPAVQEHVPGRRWLRLAIVLGLLLAVLVGAVVAYNVGRGRTPLGAEPETPTPTPTPSATVAPDPVAVEDLSATLVDPQGGGEEDEDEVSLSVDGDPATAWSTLTYFQQLGPAGLKTGLGVAVDLGQERDVTQVDLSFLGSPTSATVYATDAPPTGVQGLTPIASTEGAGTEAGLELDEPTPARYLVVWLTALPPATDGFSGGVREIEVVEVPRG